MTVDKTGSLNDINNNGFVDQGETIHYTFLVTNTGNVRLTGVTVDDRMLKVLEEPQTLEPGGTFTFSADRAPTQTQINIGSVSPTRPALLASHPQDDDQPSAADTVRVPSNTTPGLHLQKTGVLNDKNNNNLLDPGETISYTFMVTNTSTLTLTGVIVNDSMFPMDEGPQTLLPGKSFEFTHTPTQIQIDSGQVDNTATALGTPPTGPPAIAGSTFLVDSAAQQSCCVNHRKNQHSQGPQQ